MVIILTIVVCPKKGSQKDQRYHSTDTNEYEYYFHLLIKSIG